MVGRLFMVAFIASLFIPIAPSEVHGQQPFVHGSDISFNIRTDHSEYEIGDQIEVHYTIKNISRGSLYVPARQQEIKCVSNPHLWALLEDSSGRHYEPGFGGVCGGPDPVDRMSMSERMGKDALLLKPGQVAAGSFSFDSKLFADSLRPGKYRLEALLYGWNRPFDASQLSELSRMGSPFLSGESTASSVIKLRAGAK